MTRRWEKARWGLDHRILKVMCRYQKEASERGIRRCVSLHGGKNQHVTGHLLSRSTDEVQGVGTGTFRGVGPLGARPLHG